MLIGVARHTAVVSATDRWLTAVHEAGHALVAKLTEGANPVQKVTIVPHSMQGGSAGGVTVMRPREGDHVHVQHLSAQLDVCMGGRAAEELFAGREGVSVGAEMDFREARRLAVCPALIYNHVQPRATPYSPLQHLTTPYNPLQHLTTPYNPLQPLTIPFSLITAPYRPLQVLMLSRWGLGRTLGPGGVSHQSQLSVHSQQLLDAEVLETLHASHARASALLRRHRRQLRAVAEALTQQDTLSSREFDEVLKKSRQAAPVLAWAMGWPRHAAAATAAVTAPGTA
jgi:ATP-dependent Zn protease